jgi:transposase
MVRGSVEETLNALLDAEADRLCNAQRYERSEARRDSRQLLRRARRLFPFIERIFADSGYAGKKMALVVWRMGPWRLCIVKCSDAAGFEVLPKRWIVERRLRQLLLSRLQVRREILFMQRRRDSSKRSYPTCSSGSSANSILENLAALRQTCAAQYEQYLMNMPKSWQRPPR